MVMLIPKWIRWIEDSVELSRRISITIDSFAKDIEKMANMLLA
jgi:hypothetical protein